MAPPIPSAPIAASAGEARLQLASQLATLMDIEASMSLAAYNAHVTTVQEAREKGGYFAQTARKLAEHGKLVEAEKAKRSLDPRELDRYESLAEASYEVQKLFERLRIATSVTESARNVNETVAILAGVRESLNDIPSADLGKETYAKIGALLDDISQVVLAFPAVMPKWVRPALDLFLAITYRRLQQIAKGDRKRDTEPHTIQGALATYEHDVSDMVIVLRKFAVLQRDLDGGKFGSEEEFARAMLDVVPGTGKSFKDAVTRLARAKFTSHQAGEEADAATSPLEKAGDNARAAQKELAAAIDSLGIADGARKDSLLKSLTLTESALQQKDLAGAKEAFASAEAARAAADEHLDAYEGLMTRATGNAADAQKHLDSAKRLLQISATSVDLVKAGPYAQALKGETSTLLARNEAISQRVQLLDADLGDVKEYLAKLAANRAEVEGWRTKLVTALKGIGGSLKVADVAKKTDAMLKSGILDAHQRIQRLLAARGLFNTPGPRSLMKHLSPKARAYLMNPGDKSVAGDWADIRDELATVFKENPGIARAAAQEITAMEAEFAALRDKLTAEFGADSDQVRALNDVESRLAQGWADNGGVVIQALIQAGNMGKWSLFFTSDAQAAIGDMVTWTQETGVREIQQSQADPKKRMAAIQGFDAWMQQQSELRAKFEAAKGKHGDAVHDRVLFHLQLARTGGLVPFAVYVFRDGDGFHAYNPLDGRTYSSDTEDKALAKLADEIRIGKGKLRYTDSQEHLHTVDVRDPPDSMVLDVLATLGTVAGLVLLAVPEPTTATKWAGGGLTLASAAYFAGKGVIKLVDLVQHETFGNNMETWGAALDVAAGILIGLRGAGPVASFVSKQSWVTRQLVLLGKSTPLSAAEWGTFSVGVTMAGISIVQIEGDKNLSQGEKTRAIGTIVAMTALPFAVLPALRLTREIVGARTPETVSLADLEAAHEGYTKHLAELIEPELIKFRNDPSPKSLAMLRALLEQSLPDAARLYETPAMKLKGKPEWIAEGRAIIDKYSAVLKSLPEAATLSPADTEKIAGVKDRLRGTPVEVKEQGGKLDINTQGDLPEGLSDTEGRAEAKKLFEKLKADLAAFAQEKGFQYTDKGMFARVVDKANPKVTVMSAKFSSEGAGRIIVEDASGSTPFQEVIDYVSPPKNVMVEAPVGNKIAPDAQRWTLPDNNASGMPSPAELSRLLGTAGEKVGDLRAIRNLTIKEIVARIPKGADLRELPPRPDGATMGFEFSWSALNADNRVTTMRVRIHGPDPKAARLSPGGSSGTGWVAVVEKGGGARMDGDGRFHQNKYLKDAKIPDPTDPTKLIDNPFIDATHIPIQGPKNPFPPIVPGMPRREKRETPPALFR